MDRRKIRDVEEARVCLAAAAASGLSRRAWAHQEGIDARSLHGWWLVFHRQAIRASAPAAPTEPALSFGGGDRPLLGWQPVYAAGVAQLGTTQRLRHQLADDMRRRQTMRPCKPGDLIAVFIGRDEGDAFPPAPPSSNSFSRPLPLPVRLAVARRALRLASAGLRASVG